MVSSAGDSGESSGPSAADIDAFIQKLNEHEGVVERDSGKATAGTSAAVSIGSSGSLEKLVSGDLDDPLKDQIVRNEGQWRKWYDENEPENEPVVSTSPPPAAGRRHTRTPTVAAF